VGKIACGLLENSQRCWRFCQRGKPRLGIAPMAAKLAALTNGRNAQPTLSIDTPY
jgi:hypothetical protein